MQIDLRELAEGQTRLEMDLTGDSVGLKPEEAVLDAPIHLVLNLDRRGDEIWIRGKAQTTAHQECSRCLAEFPENLELDFDVFCAKVPNSNVQGHPALDEEDGGVHFHDGRTLSIDGEIREAVILGLSMQPLCREDCKGLCPRCGEDRNAGPCRCEREAAAPAARAQEAAPPSGVSGVQPREE